MAGLGSALRRVDARSARCEQPMYFHSNQIWKTSPMTYLIQEQAVHSRCRPFQHNRRCSALNLDGYPGIVGLPSSCPKFTYAMQSVCRNQRGTNQQESCLTPCG